MLLAKKPGLITKIFLTVHYYHSAVMGYDDDLQLQNTNALAEFCAVVLNCALLPTSCWTFDWNMKLDEWVQIDVPIVKATMSCSTRFSQELGGLWIVCAMVAPADASAALWASCLLRWGPTIPCMCCR